MPEIEEIHEEDYLCSIGSSNDTASNLPGPGRNLGNLYSFLGRYLEHCIGTVAGKMGYGPKAIALKIRRIQDDCLPFNPIKHRKLVKYSKRTARYLSSDVISNQEQALDNIMNLGIMDFHLRETLRQCAAPKIHQIQRMSTASFRHNGTVLVKAHRALTVLDDSRVNYLVDTFFSDHYYIRAYNSALLELDMMQVIESARSELETYYSHPDYSFLVLRHMLHRFQKNSFTRLMIQRFLLAPFNDATNRSMDKIQYLDHAIEWSVFDEFVNISLPLFGPGIPIWSVCDTNHVPPKMIDMILRNADKLPLSLQKISWVQDLETYRSDKIVNAYAILFNYHQFLQNFPGYDPSKYTHEVAISIRRRLDNPLDMVLAGICAESYKEKYINNQDQNYSMAYIKLAEALNNNDQDTHQHALRNIGVVLSINRYARQGMLRALDPYVAPSKKSFRSLVERIKPIPQFDTQSLYVKVTRHVDTRGRIIHLENPICYTGSHLMTVCNGECGAVEEHIMSGEYAIGERVDSMLLRVDPEDPLSIAGHDPLLAGSAADGGALFVARSFLGGRSIFHTVADGMRPRDLKLRTHYLDGSTYKGDLNSEEYAEMGVCCLRYDPFVYKSNDSPSPGSDGMDATGPYSWRFSRKLPAERSKDQMGLYSLFGAPPVLWQEVIHEPKEHAHIQEFSDNARPNDAVLVPEEVIQEANVWAEE